MNVTNKEQSAANPTIYGNSLQKDSAEHESYAGVRNPDCETSGATIPPDKPLQASWITENNITDANEPTERLLERILERDNLNQAYKKVKANKGAGGVDKMRIEELLPYLLKNGEAIKQAIMEGKYKPNPVRRVEIPKDDGKKRPLGIPTVVDRVIQQAIAQVLSPIFEKQFSDNSYGFRPKRGAHGAIKRSQENIEDGYKYVVENKLFLKVNKEKTVVDYVGKVKFLGMSFYQNKGKARVRIHPKSVAKMKAKIRQMTARSNGWSNEARIEKLKQYIRGWVNYFKIADIKSLLKETDEWMRRRIRMVLWKQWKKVKTKFERLQKLGLDKQKAWEYANTRKGYWRTANSPILSRTLQNDVLKRMGYLFLSDYYRKVTGVN